MKKNAWLFGLSALVALAAGVGCGDDADDGGSFSSGVSPSKQGEDVTEEEAEQFCEALDAYVDARAASHAEQCLARALVAAGVVALVGGTDEQIRDTCSEAEDECLEEPATEPETADCSGTPVPVSCTSTVGEIERCVTDRVNQNRAVIAGRPSCSSVTAEKLRELQEAQEEREPPASCEPVRENCAEVALRIGL